VFPAPHGNRNLFDRKAEQRPLHQGLRVKVEKRACGEGLEGGALHRLEARRRVPDPLVSHDAREERKEALADPTAERSLVGVFTHVPRADHDIGTSRPHGGDESGYVFGAVLTIGIQKDDDLISGRKGVPQADLQRPAVSQIEWESKLPFTQALYDGRRGVGRSVVDHEPVERRGHMTQLVEDPAYRRLFVVSRKQDEDFSGRLARLNLFTRSGKHLASHGLLTAVAQHCAMWPVCRRYGERARAPVHEGLYLTRMRSSSAMIGAARRTSPHELLDGPVTVLAPHMDDEVLGCGATLAAVAGAQSIHIVYVTDGARSPIPEAPWIGRASADLSGVRAGEACRAMRTLGIPDENLRFLDLRDRVLALLEELRPRYLLVPFRYDRHRDHVATNRAAVNAAFAGSDESLQIQIVEYFIYYRSRILPRGDVRRYVRPDQLAIVDTSKFSALKRRALECYETQTTVFFEWQRRPNLTRRFVDEVSASPEAFVLHSPSLSGSRIFERGAGWVRWVQAIEQPLKRAKDRGAAIVGSIRTEGST